MPTDIDLDALDSLLDNGAQLIEVLPRDEYDEEHLPSAVNIPVRELTVQAAAALDRQIPVVVYCWDSL